MCTIYEYFASGRCTELTGPDGAYNLYESELRQNLIINRLDVIITQLENIAKTQYMLYNELKETKALIAGISKEVHKICKSVQNIEVYSAISAHNSSIIAHNTAVSAYLN